MAKLTTQEMLAKIKQRKALAEAKKRREERLTARKTLNERTRKVRPTVARKPLVEKTVAPARKAIVETRLNARRNNRPETLNESITRRNREIGVDKNKGQNLVYSILAENIYNYGRALDGLRNPGALRESTQANAGTFGATGNGAGVGMVQTFFDIFYGYFPKLITPTIASVQPMKHEQGFIFYMQYVAGSDKGLVQKGDVLIDPFQVNTDPDYTSERVTLLKDIKATGAHTATRALWNPVKPRSVAIGNAELVWTDDNTFTGEIEGVAITGGTVTTTETQATVAFTLAGDLEKEVDVSYAYDNVFAPTEVPELEANVERLPIQAKYRTIKTNIAFQAAYGFEAEHGADLGSKLAEAAIFQLQRETDLEAVKHIFDAAPETVVWNRSAGFAVGGFTNHKLTFEDAIVNAANRIFEKSKRVRGNVLIVGIDALNVIETLPGFDGRVIGEQLEGAGVVGKYKKMPVVAIPELPKNHWAVIYKSEVDNFDAGLVFAPYLPVFSTEPVTLDDFLIRRAFITAYAMKVVNPNYFVRGLIVSDPVAMPVYLISKDGTDTALGQIDEDAALGIF